MRKLFFLSAITLLAMACNTESEKTETSGDGDMNALYEQHLTIVKSNIEAFSNKNHDAQFASIADTAVWNSPMYGDTVTSKAHWRESLEYWTTNWDSLHLVNPIFLPGVSQETNKPDGSVRYYGVWEGVHKATGIRTSVSIYEFFNFNTDHKISTCGSFFDVGGLMNAVSKKQ